MTQQLGTPCRSVGIVLLAIMIGAACAQEAGEVAYAAPTQQESPGGTPPACANPCWLPGAAYPFPSCNAACGTDCEKGGTGIYQSKEVCCSPGVAFPGGCMDRPRECWIVESFSLRSCVRDDRKCLQGSGVYASEEVCCAPGAAFPDGCANVTLAATPCWVVDTWWPARQCRPSRTLCGPDAGVQSFASKEACCSPAAEGGAFSEGCSTYTPVTPCWMVDSHYPDRACALTSDAAICNRGWGVFQSEEVCCARGAGFPEGCSKSTAAVNNNVSSGALPAAASPEPSAQPAAQPAVMPAAVQPATVQPAAVPNTTAASPVVSGAPLTPTAPAVVPGAASPTQSPIIVSTTPLPANSSVSSNTTSV